jgi:PAS domain S-box-containing protein
VSGSDPAAAPGLATVGAGRDGCIRYFDDGAVRMFGYAREQVVGQRIEVIVPVEHREAHRVGFERAIAGGSRTADAAPFHLPILLADQSVRVFAVRFVFLDAPYGGMVGALILVQPAAADAEPFSDL